VCVCEYKHLYLYVAFEKKKKNNTSRNSEIGVTAPRHAVGCNYTMIPGKGLWEM